MRNGRTAWRCAFALGLMVLGCTGELDAGPHGRGGAAAGSCALPAPSSRARRLTRREIARSLEDVLGVSIDETALVSDEVTAGFAANAVAPISERELDALVGVSEEAAASALGHAVPRCADDACVAAFLDDVGARLARRPLIASERAELTSRTAAWRVSEGVDEAMRMLTTALVISPRFLYVIETGTGERREDGAERLSGTSVAARLSLLLVGHGPDTELLAEAALGGLDSPEGVALQATRLSQSPEAAEHTTEFLAEWLELSRVRDSAKDETLFPFWSPTLARSMERDAQLVLHELVLSGAGVEALLTTNVAYVDATLAPVLGVAAPPSGTSARVELAARHGILTFPAFLAGHAHSAETSWVQRGLFVRRRLLCEEIAPPPPGIDFTSVAPGGRVSHPTCGACHRSMDPIGQAFDRFDAAGLPTGTSGGGALIDDDPELSGDFASPEELSDRLAGADAVRECFARQAYRFAHRRVELGTDRCAIAQIADRWQGDGGSLDQLLLSVATDESFRWASRPNPGVTE